MLIGKYENLIDEKSRIVIPAKFREDLGRICVVAEGIDNCLCIYSVEEWDNYIKKLKNLPNTDTVARNYLRKLYMSASDQEIDKQGRVKIPSEIRESAGIVKELITIGSITKIEVWSKEIWAQTENGGTKNLTIADIEEGLLKYDI